MASVLKPFLAVIFSSCLVVWGAGAPIGVVTAGGDFHLAGSSVRGNGTLFAGDTIASDKLRANVIVNGGKELTLAPHSRGKVFEQKTILEAGAGELRTSTPYALEAGSFRLSLDSGKAVVGITPATGKVRVMAKEGQVSVRNTQGILIARVSPGRTLDFEPQGTGGASGAVEYVGKVSKTGDGKFLVTDETTGVTVEIRGATSDLDAYSGLRVRVRGAIIDGATPPPGASSVVSVTSIGVSKTVAASAISGGTVAAIAGVGATGALFTGLAAADVGPFSEDASR